MRGIALWVALGWSRQAFSRKDLPLYSFDKCELHFPQVWS